jgi:hypothetical protein
MEVSIFNLFTIWVSLRNQLDSRFQLTWAAVQISGSCADATVTSQRLQNMYRCAFVGQLQYRNTLHHQGLFVRSDAVPEPWFDERSKCFRTGILTSSSI